MTERDSAALRVISREEIVPWDARVVIVAAYLVCVLDDPGRGVGGWMADPASRANGIYFGFFNGAWWALLTSFAWPWIMPAAIDRWMYRSEVG